MTQETLIQGHWRFLWLGEDTGVEDTLYTRTTAEGIPVTLPHTFAWDGSTRHGLGAYACELPIDPVTARAFLSFDAVDQCCRVWINGAERAHHEGGYSRFRVPVPEEAIRAGQLRVLVLADNRVNEHVSPHFGDFTVVGGIPRPVRLLCSGEICFDRGYYGTDGLIVRSEVTAAGDGLLSVEPHLLGDSANAVLRITLRDPQGEPVIKNEYTATDAVQLQFPSPQRWNGREAAALYTLTAELRVNDQAVDSLSLRTGFRSATATAEGFRLNGQPCFLRGVAKHQDRCERFTAVTDADIREDFDIVDEVGANAVRLSHYQHPQAAYEECDERGILCWAEIPMLKMTEDAALQENAELQLTELILQNLHHPSIFCWGIQNEIAMFRDAPFMHENCRALHALAKRLDPSRMTACANLYPVPPESELNGITDLVGYNYYFGWYYGEAQDYGTYLDAFHVARPNVPVGITEYGADGNLALHSAEPRVKDYSEEYQALYHERAYPYLKARPWLWGSFIWNLFDFSSERRNEGGITGLNAKGLVSWDRRTRKDAFYYYQAQWTSTPCLHLCGKRYARREGETADFKVYTNCAEVTLAVNGQPVATAANDGSGVVCFPAVPLEIGENVVRVSSGDHTDEAVFLRVAKEPSSYRLPESEGGAVTNWFLQGEPRKDRFSILNTAQQVLDHTQAAAVLRETFPDLYRLLTEESVVPLGLTMKSILSRDVKDPDRIGAFNQALQEVPLHP